jgi:hypothetical protein
MVVPYTEVAGIVPTSDEQRLGEEFWAAEMGHQNRPLKCCLLDHLMECPESHQDLLLACHEFRQDRLLACPESHHCRHAWFYDASSYGPTWRARDVKGIGISDL